MAAGAGERSRRCRHPERAHRAPRWPAPDAGTINGSEHTSSVMPAGSGRLALSVSKKMLAAAGLSVGEEATFEIDRVPPG
ncbi:MAG TPA: DUF1905 domain-containing protein [Chloroflexota bacterium]